VLCNGLIEKCVCGAQIGEHMRKTMYDMLYLAACSINSKTPEKERVTAMDLEKLYQVCQLHSVTSLVAVALEASGVPVNKEWKETRAKAMRKEMLFDAERAKILDFMEKNGIWYLPLKGILLKKYYPKLGMRQMSDNDILFDSSFQEVLCNYMKSQGYQAEDIGHGNHDIYQKPPVLNFEMHTSLYGASHDKTWVEYYDNVKERLILEEGKQYGYRFREEDFYIYIVTHEFKHFDGGGTGVRSLVDVYAYLKQQEQNLDWKYIKEECTKLGIAEFEVESRILSQKIFSNEVLPELSGEEQNMLNEYLASGVYGTQERSYRKRVERYQKKTGKTSKFSYIWSRIFPDMETYRLWYPFFYKHKWLLPVGWLYRLIRGVTVRRKRIQVEFDVVMDRDEEK